MNCLGDSYLKSKDYEKAIEIYWQSDQLRSEIQQIDENNNQAIREIENNKVNETLIMEQEVPVEGKGENMNESNHVFDLKSASEWNAHGNSHLRAGAYNDAIVAYTKAIELAPDGCWPYIQNLAQVHYQKGKARGKSLVGFNEDPDIWEGENESDSTSFNGYDVLQTSTQGSAIGELANEDPIRSSSNYQPTNSVVSGIEHSNTTYPVNGGSSQEDKPYFEEGNETTNVTVVNSNCFETTQASEDSISHSSENHSKPKLDDNPPQNSIDWNELGNSYTNTKNYDNAIEAYQKAIEMNPGYGQPYSNLGFIYYCLGKYEVSIRLYKESVSLLDTKEDKVISWNKLGDCYRRLGDYENALIAYQKASELAPAINPVMARGKATLLENILAR
jgi:tetratricopeptide (TPR) repeat protein